MGHQIKQIRTISQVEIGSDLFFTVCLARSAPRGALNILLVQCIQALQSYNARHILECMFVNDVRPKRRKNNQVQRIVKRPAGVEREGRSEAEERPNEAHRAARRGEIIAR